MSAKTRRNKKSAQNNAFVKLVAFLAVAVAAAVVVSLAITYTHKRQQRQAAQQALADSIVDFP